MAGEFNLTENEKINILVGQQGLTGAGNFSSWGGGVSAVWKPSGPEIMIAAGGGGGVTEGNFSSTPSLSNAQTSINGAGGQSSPTWNNYAGGTNGNGGGSSSGNGGAGSGGGWLSDAGNDTSGAQGFGRPNGWLGGNQRTTASDRLSGSFGGSGGASGNSTSYKGGGGGGGYSGGGAGVGDGVGSSGAGGGWGSFNSGTNQSNTSWSNSGHWSVTIELIWGSTPPPPASTYTVTLNRDGWSGGSTSVSTTFWSPMPSITLPTKSWFTFGGYFTALSGAWTRYYNADGSSARNYDISSSTTLYASWTSTTYSVTHAWRSWGIYLVPSSLHGIAISHNTNRTACQEYGKIPAGSSWSSASRFDWYCRPENGSFYVVTSGCNWCTSFFPALTGRSENVIQPCHITNEWHRWNGTSWENRWSGWIGNWGTWKPWDYVLCAD